QPDENGVSTEMVQAAEGQPHVHRIHGQQGMAHGLDGQAPIGLSPPSDNNGIFAHGGPVMTTVNGYYIWHGNWARHAAQTILSDLAVNIGSSPYWNINTTYFGPSANHVTSTVRFAGSTTDFYSRGTALSDAGVAGVVSDSITSGRLPNDPSGVY